MIAALKGGHRWHGAVVCPGTTTGWLSAPAFSPIPVGRTDGRMDTHTHKRIWIFNREQWRFAFYHHQHL